MWLPKDERKLLIYYFLVLGEVDKEKRFSEEYSATVLSGESIKQIRDRANKWNEGDVEDKKQESKRSIKELNRVKIANKTLQKRGLIIVKPHQHETGINLVSLNLDGWDLGKKYSSWWTRSGLCFAEYKHHWIWLIMSLLGGVIGALLTNWLLKVIQAGYQIPHGYTR